MTNFNKLFTLDSETLDILKETKNQSKFVRDAVKHFSKNNTVIEVKEPIVTQGRNLRIRF